MNVAPPVLPDRVLGVPLRTEVIGLDRRTHLVVWNGGPGVVVTPKRRPGFWCPTPDGNVAEVAEKRRLSDTSAPPSTWYRLSFETVHDASEYAKRMRREGLGSYIGDEDRWTTRLLVEEPDYFRAWPMTRPLRFAFVDVEQYSEGGVFPKRDAPMVSISIGLGDGTAPRVWVARPDENGMPDDRNLVMAWKGFLMEFDPDIIVAFNAGYDMMVLAARGAYHGFPYAEWGRRLENGERMMSYEYTPAGGRKTDRTIYVGGRIVWDIRKNANSTADYNLAGVKDEKLKTIARFLGLPVIEENTADTASLWRERPDDLVQYNRNDVILIEHLGLRYIKDRVALAEFYGAPLDMVLDAPGGWGGTIASARVLYSQGIVSDGRNIDRHRAYIRLIQTDEDEDGERTLKFEGAHVALYKRGLHRPLHKADFASLYPRVMEATRMGPDNTRIVGTRSLDAEPRFRVERDGDVARVFVPDEKYKHAWVIEIRGESVFTPILKARMNDRLAAKEAGDAERANILKTLLNAMFGVHGAMGNRYGVLPIAIICVALSRELIRALEDTIGDAKVETDTDGVYCDRKVSASLLTRSANKVAEGFGFEPVFEVETETYEAGYFHEAKTYLLLSKGKMKRHGVAMKGKALPAAFDRVMEEVGRPLLEGRRDDALAIAKGLLDLGRFEPREFVQRARLNKDISTYVSETKEVKIARLYEKTYGVEPSVGTSYEYVRVRGGERVPPTPDALRNLDHHYYMDAVVLRALERLGFTREELGIVAQVQTMKEQSKRPRGETSLAAFGMT